MRPLSTNDIRARYLSFYKEKGYAIIPGASLVPENDPTVLFTTAGMHPLVPYLLGEPHPAGKCIADVQRSVRTQDIDEVGDASHLTFFEMLGRWNLGDENMKENAITKSYEFMTEKLGIPKSHFAVTCFEGDSDAPRDTESAAIWKKIGVPVERIGWLPKAKNWWGPAGQTGPCGPDTEMFYWVGEGEPTGNPATHDAQWLEIGNDVLMQYDKQANGSFIPLRQKNLDEGLGLERLAMVLQGVSTVYETDAMQPIFQAVAPSGLLTDDADEGHIVSSHVRIVTDHLRAATFIVADGVVPSNVDQGYVLRRLIRRAIRSLRFLNIERDAQFETTHTYASSIAAHVISQYAGAYPHLQSRKDSIIAALNVEEEQFKITLREGLKKMEKTLSTLSDSLIDGQTAFHLYDTYGFPLELTKDIAKERGIRVDEEGFHTAFAQHQALSRAGAEQKFKGGLADHSAQTTKLHTATHLLNAALKKVLGDHVNQKGSNITAERLRFDFNHPDKMTAEQLAEVERLVNEAISADLQIAYHVTTVEGAKNEGAVGVFDARYGSEVKVYVVGDTDHVFSKEICGGPHVARTGMLGSFKIQKEESSSAGVRRIKAVVSGGPPEIVVAGEA